MRELGVTRAFLANLEQWVEVQKAVLASMVKAGDQFKEADRLELILAARAAFKHMIRTLEAFDKWLQDPFIIAHMPREMLEGVQRESWDIMKRLLELDIEHTTQFKEYVGKLAREGRLNPLLAAQGPGEREVLGIL